jgi:hypothetical protein
MAYDGRLRFEGVSDGGGFPVELVIDNDCKGADLSEGNKHWPLTPKELEGLRDEIDELLNPSKRYVTVGLIRQVEREWHYEDTSGTLQKDDLVRVNWGGATKVGIVRGTDRTPPSWLGKPGGEIKPVLAKFTAEEL